ncbi:MAG: aldehyde ferredoxin oxidoreductase family protein [Candidatus Adiutricales bacterium]
MINGYNGRILEVDLSSGVIGPRDLADDVIKKYVGGRGLGVYLLTQTLAPQTDPFAEESLLVISSGGLGGSLTPSNARFSVTFKSPLSQTMASANSGGAWGAVLKGSGYDAVVIKGIAAAPVYLKISETRVELVECVHLWGKTIPEFMDGLSGRLSKKDRVLAIGPAGENKVLFASMINDSAHAVGRGGAGAVMGSKNLKAIIVTGGKKFQPADKGLYEAGIQQAGKLIRNMPITSKALPELGTAGLIKLIADHDMLPHRNFKDTIHAPEKIEKITGEYLRKKILTSKKSCLNCPIACSRKTRVGRKSGEGPEFETIGMMGANLGIYDIKEIALANYVCNENGLDTISFGNTLGLVMELFEKGIISRQDTGGIDLKFGTRGVLEKLAEKTARRRDLGDLMAMGAQRLAREKKAGPLAMTVKGLELPAYDPRASYLQALGYATSPRGGCHLQGGYAINLGFFGGPRQVNRFLVDTTAGHLVNLQDSGCVGDIMGVCRFAFFSINEFELSRIYAGFTGIDVSPDELKTAAKRTQNLERDFNCRAGFSKQDDTLPDRFFEEEIEVDRQMRSIDKTEQLGRMIEKFYEIRGWDEQGVPLANTLK